MNWTIVNLSFKKIKRLRLDLDQNGEKYSLASMQIEFNLRVQTQNMVWFGIIQPILIKLIKSFITCLDAVKKIVINADSMEGIGRVWQMCVPVAISVHNVRVS